MTPANPLPVTAPIRPQASCTASSNGTWYSAVHNWPNPNCAPVCEYVAIPDGSSSAAPVITPGPSIRRNLTNPLLLDFFDSRCAGTCCVVILASIATYRFRCHSSHTCIHPDHILIPFRKPANLPTRSSSMFPKSLLLAILLSTIP